MATYTLLKGVDALRHQLTVEEVSSCDPAVVDTILELDLVTFSDPPNTHFTAAVFLRHGRVFLMKSDDVAIGTSLCMRSWEDPSEVVLLKVAVRTGYRNRGFGSFFMGRVLELLTAQGVRSVVILLEQEDRRSQHLYEHKFGFEVVRLCVDEEPDGRERIMMRKILARQDPASSLDFDL